MGPSFAIHQYTDEIYKVVYFKRGHDDDHITVRDPDTFEHKGVKLDASFSRARSMVLQYALCNPWDYFFTGTLDRKKMNRYDLETYAAQLSQWIRDRRKQYGVKFNVLLVPELHKDCAWHMHGFVHGLPGDVLERFKPPAPLDLVRSDFLNWPDYERRFGFCSLGPIKDPVKCAFYVTKYIGKGFAGRDEDVGKHLYFHSRPLKKAEKASDVYGYNAGLESLCVNDYQFCKTGMVLDQDFTFPLAFDGADYEISPFLDRDTVLRDFDPASIEPTYEQLSVFR